jgi:[ribosomal protein S18]-alanine N-acetyltransferase
MTWQLLRAKPADLEAIMAIETATFPTDAWSPETMAAELGGPHGHYLVAIAEDGALDGYAGLFAAEGAEQADIQTIAVVPRARRRGLGRTLLVALLDEARRRGAREVLLEVRADNAGAQALYAELGFEQIAVRPGYYQPEGVDALVLRLTLGAGETG